MRVQDESAGCCDAEFGLGWEVSVHGSVLLFMAWLGPGRRRELEASGHYRVTESPASLVGSGFLAGAGDRKPSGCGRAQAAAPPALALH